VQDYEYVWNHVVTEAARNSDEKTLVLQYFGCHGMMEQNMQQIIISQADGQSNQAIRVEQRVRQMA
jgi:hypothetical protein